MTRGGLAAVALAIGLVAVAAWCVWVIRSASTLRHDVTANVNALEAVRELRSRAARPETPGTADGSSLSSRGRHVEKVVAARGRFAVDAARALMEAAVAVETNPAEPAGHRALDEAADRVVGLLRADNRRVSIALGDRWRWLNYVAVVVLALAASLLAVVIISHRRRLRAEASEAALRARTLTLQDAAQSWAAGALSKRASTRDGVGDDFADVLERLRLALARHVAELERRNQEVAELASDLRAQLIQKTEQLELAVAGPPGTPRILAGQYELVGTLGVGGMGAVHEVRRLADGRTLALKLMKDPGDEKLRARFLREARLLAEVSHANVVRILDVGVHEGQPYLITELIEGRSLAAVDGPWPPERARSVLRAVAAGLSAIHGRGIVHRDLKLSNVMVGRDAAGDDITKIIDFGIAGDMQDATGPVADVDNPLISTATAAVGTPDTTRVIPSRDHLTTPGMLVGTLRYMAPELRLSGRLAPAADVFAFGVLAVKLLTGEFPWPQPAVVIAKRTGRLPPPSFDVSPPAELRTLLQACLDLDPARRPTANEILLQLVH